MITCYDLSNQTEIKLLYTLFFQIVTDFLQEDVIYQNSCFRKLVINRDSKNKKAIAKLIQRYRMKKVIVLIYQPQVNGIIEREHKLIINIFTKILDGGFINQV